MHCWQRVGGTGELEFCLLYVVCIKVCIAECVDEVSEFQVCDLRDHHGEQGVGGDVEGYAEEDICAALVELAGELAVCDVELEEAVAGGECHLINLADVP